MSIRLTEIEATVPGRPVRPEDDRLPTFFGGPDDARERLSATRVLIAGCGSVGGPVALDLARLGLGEVIIVDPKVFGGNMSTQPIGPDDIGAPKAVTIGRRVKHLAPDTRVRVAVGTAQDLGWADLVDVDAIIGSTDNLLAEVEIGRRAAALGCPLLYASVHGPTLTAQVRVLVNSNGGPCIACGFNDVEWSMVADDEAAFQCGGGDAGGRAGMPTMSVAALCGTAAHHATLQFLRHVLDLGRPLEDVMLEYNAYAHTATTTPLRPNPTCPIEHGTLVRGGVPEVATATLRSCADAVGMATDLDRTLISVGDLEFASHVHCQACDTTASRPGFGQPGQPVDAPCPACGDRNTLFMDAAGMFKETPGSALTDVLDRPLSEVGAADAGSVTIRAEGRAGLVTAPAREATTR